MLVPGALSAQGPVSGRVTIQEREGETTKDLATAVIYLETPGGAIGPAREVEAEIAMHDKTYTPHVRVVPAGSTVAFPNQDPFRHNVFSNSSAGPFDLGLTPRGQAAKNLFRRPGVYAIYCNIHSRMSAFVVAVASPYYTQPGADGAFTLASVPAGRYVLHVWHERRRRDDADGRGAGGRARGADRGARLPRLPGRAAQEQVRPRLRSE